LCSPFGFGLKPTFLQGYQYFGTIRKELDGLSDRRGPNVTEESDQILYREIVCGELQSE